MACYELWEKNNQKWNYNVSFEIEYMLQKVNSLGDIGQRRLVQICFPQVDHASLKVVQVQTEYIPRQHPNMIPMVEHIIIATYKIIVIIASLPVCFCRDNAPHPSDELAEISCVINVISIAQWCYMKLHIFCSLYYISCTNFIAFFYQVLFNFRDIYPRGSHCDYRFQNHVTVISCLYL